MSPQAIPWIFCSALCLLPLLGGSGAFFAWCSFTNRFPTMDVSDYTGADGRKHHRIEWDMLSREELRFRGKTEEKE